jgi:hypothetical protein
MPVSFSRRRFAALTVAALALPALPALAAEGPAEFAKSLYALDNFWSDVLASPSKYLTEDFARIVEENANYDDELDYAIDYDPLIQAQDWETLQNLTVTVEEESKATAKVQVSFDNSGQPTSVVLELALTGKGWRLADVINADGGSLVQEYSALNAAGKAAKGK